MKKMKNKNNFAFWTKKYFIRDDTHMTSMKIIQFSGPSTPKLDVQFQTNTPMITNQLKKA